MWKRWAYPLLAVVVFLTVAVGVRLVWDSRDLYPTTGDEPHYLIAARSLAHFHTVDMTEAYQEEFTRGYYYPPRFPAAPGALPTKDTTAHAREGPHGYAFQHGLGISILVALPTEWWGPTGARMALVVFASGLVLVAWGAAGLFLGSREAQLAATLVVSVALPWVTLANQIVPDLIAGICCAVGVLGCTYLALRGATRSAPIVAWIAAIIVAFLPWIHIRFASTGALLIAVMCWFSAHARTRSVWSSVALAAPFAVSMLCVFAYNQYVFDDAFSVNGGNGHLTAGKSNVMVFLGMHLDRLQGVLVQNPLLVLGLAGIFLLWTRSRVLAVAIALAYASVMMLPSFELALYGGQTLGPRFGMAGAAVLVVPTMTALGCLRMRSGAAFVGVLLAAALLQCWYLARAVFGDLELHNHAGPPPLPGYPSLLPVATFFEPERFYRIAQNYVAVGLLLVVVAGLTVWLWPRRRAASASVGSVQPSRASRPQA